MKRPAERIIDAGKEPNATAVTAWIGVRNYSRWMHITHFIETNYPGVFNVEWLWGGKKWGWTLRYKKSKSFCTLIPERNVFKILLVFGAEERKKVEALLPELVSHIRDDYAAATTYHDGKWVIAVVDSRVVLSDIEKLLVLKRNPRRKIGKTT